MKVRHFASEDPERPPVASRRWAIGAAVGVAATVTTAVISAALLWGATAGATPASVLQTVTPTPTESPGNVTTCEDAGLDGVILLSGEAQGENNAPDDTGPAGTATVSDDGTTLTVTINAGFTATGVVVKGGPNFNVYTGPFVGPITLAGLQSPVNPGGNVPKISHYFVCGNQSMTTTTTAPPTTTTTTTTTDTTTVTVTTTSTSLPVTGGSATGLLAVGVALVAAGGFTLVLLRRRRAAIGE